MLKKTRFEFSKTTKQYRPVALQFQRGEVGGNKNDCHIRIELYFFSLYINFSLPDKFLCHRKYIATWDNNKECMAVDGRIYGFYFFDWAFVWAFHAKVNESSTKDPWWMHQYIHLDELILGKWNLVCHNITSVEKVDFKLGEKVFTMDSIKWERFQRFRSRIPFGLYHQNYCRVQMDISNPPSHAGKGENSWDCDDDATFGLSAKWEHETPTWTSDKNEIAKKAVDMYVKSVLRDVKKYGKASDKNAIPKEAPYQFLGLKRFEDGGRVL